MFLILSICPRTTPKDHEPSSSRMPAAPQTCPENDDILKGASPSTSSGSHVPAWLSHAADTYFCIILKCSMSAAPAYPSAASALAMARAWS